MIGGLTRGGLRAAPAVVLLCLFIGACGGDDTSSSSSTSTTDRDDPNAVCHDRGVRQVVVDSSLGIIGVVCNNGIYYPTE